MNKEAEEKFHKFLKEAKNRITPERFEVMEAAIDYSGHFGADDLFISMKNRKLCISRATVYNTLELLAQCGLLVKRNFGENLNRYECTFKKNKHEHIVCVKCGKIVEFSNPALVDLINEISEKTGFEITDYYFNVYGKCDVCRKND
jgi:Fur family transcriptional regulator, ferric uptake regulator